MEADTPKLRAPLFAGTKAVDFPLVERRGLPKKWLVIGSIVFIVAVSFVIALLVTGVFTKEAAQKGAVFIPFLFLKK